MYNYNSRKATQVYYIKNKFIVLVTCLGIQLKFLLIFLIFKEKSVIHCINHEINQIVSSVLALFPEYIVVTHWFKFVTILSQNPPHFNRVLEYVIKVKCLLCLEDADAHFVHQFPPSREQEAEKLEDVRDTHCKHSFGILHQLGIATCTTNNIKTPSLDPETTDEVTSSYLTD